MILMGPRIALCVASSRHELYQQKFTHSKKEKGQKGRGSLSFFESISKFHAQGFTEGTLVLIEPSSKPAMISSIMVFTSAGTSPSRS